MSSVGMNGNGALGYSPPVAEPVAVSNEYSYSYEEPAADPAPAPYTPSSSDNEWASDDD